jgi:molybdopterin-guanine dinucleotide biosynthesis protein A
MPAPVGCILAGGQAQRMGGGDKALLKLGSETMLAHIIGRLAPQVAALVVNANGNPERFSAFGLPVIADSIGGFAGPLAGILAGLEWAAARNAERIASVAADIPFLPADLIARLGAACRGNDIACAASGGRRHPVIGLWPTRLAPELREALAVENVRKVENWTARYRVGIAEWTNDPYDPFFNVNRPQDLIEADRILTEYFPSCPK